MFSRGGLIENGLAVVFVASVNDFQEHLLSKTMVDSAVLGGVIGASMIVTTMCLCFMREWWVSRAERRRLIPKVTKNPLMVVVSR